MQRPLIRVLATAGLLVSLSLPASAQDMPLDWKAGYSWKYQWIDLWRKEQVGTVEREVLEQTREGYKSVFRGKTASYDDVVMSDGSVVRSYEGLVGAPAKNALVAFRLPHKEGSSWQYMEYWPSQYGSGAVSNQVKCEAKGNEQVEVPLGKFDAQRVDCRGVWSSPSGGSGRTELITWYSPELKWVVRWRSKSWMGSSLQQQEEFRLYETTVPR